MWKYRGNIWRSITGEPNQNTFRERFIATISLFVAVSCLIGTFVNFYLGLHVNLSFLTFTSAFIYGYIYYLSRFKHQIKIARIVLTMYSLLFFNILWFYNNGSRGPVPYNFVVYFSVMIFIWEKKVLRILGYIVFSNILVLMGAELIFPGQFNFSYPSNASRVIDVYVGVTIYTGIVYILINTAKQNLEIQIERAKYADRLKSSFLANVSHEIRTPLNAILGFSELLCRKEIEPGKKELYTSLIKSNGENLIRLIDDIIDISKIESNQTVISEDACNINELLKKIHHSFQPVLKNYQKEHLVFNYLKPNPPFSIKTDCVRLEQIFSNLILNAIKFTSKGSILFGCEEKDDIILFFVKDTGPGIPVGYTGKIFERFTKLDVEFNRYEQGGLGIGLFLSKHLVSLLGGEIWVESVPGENAEFYFTLPKKEHQILPGRKTRLHSNNHYNFSGKNILICEDNDSNFGLLEETLSATSANIYRALHGREALDIIMKDPKKFDLILMDISMPVMDGYEATRKIRVFNEKVPVLALTAYAMAGDREKCIKAGCNDYMAKPFSRDELFPVLDHLLFQVDS